MRGVVIFGLSFLATAYWSQTLVAINLVGTGSRGDWTPEYAIATLMYALGTTAVLIAAGKSRMR